MNKNLIFNKENIGLGKRKQAVARVFLISGTGKLIVNQIPGEKYFQFNTSYIKNIWLPLKKLNVNEQFDIVALVKGGGLTGQCQAIQLGVSRLICNIQSNNRSILKPLGLLTRDTRIKERKKYGLRKARKAPQYSKR